MARRLEEVAAEAEVTSHRRRRRRRGTEDIEIEGSDDDEVETVTKGACTASAGFSHFKHCYWCARFNPP